MEVELKKLKEALAGNADFTSRSETDLVGDFRLSRFLLGREMDVEKAKTMYVDHLNWRKENDIENIRAQVIDKPLLVSSLPHAEELKAAGMGLQTAVVNGGRSRLGEVVYMEALGGSSHIEVPHGKGDEYMKYLFEHYYGFFERRSLELERLSITENRMVKCVQIRDFSQLSLMPQGGVFSIIRKILKGGLDNYPESASHALFINSPPMFSAVFAIVKRWLPDDTKKKLRFFSGDHVAEEMMKFVRPPVIVCSQRMLTVELGDILTQELMLDSASTAKNWKQVVEKHVSARNAEPVYFSMSSTGTRTITWERNDEMESPKSVVRAKILFVKKEHEQGVHPDSVHVECEVVPAGNSCILPEGVSEALLVLVLDHSASWFQGHKFRLTVEGS